MDTQFSHAPGYERAATLEEVTRALARPGAMPLGGGTDLIPLMRAGLSSPRALVDVRHIPGARMMEWSDDGALAVAHAVGLAHLARDARVLASFPVLAEACGRAGSPQLRNMGTIGGNLCQRPRCEYWRHGFACHKSGGDSCPAAVGDNRSHAIFGGGPCIAVHPSDPAVALSALDAVVHVAGPNGVRAIPIAQFFVLPVQRLELETVLERGEIVTAVTIPAAAARGWQRYLKLTQRATWDFATVSLAATRRTDGTVRLVLGGVAPVPWRVSHSIEEDLAAGDVSDDDIDTLAERALYDAQPLAHNQHKIDLAATVLRRAMHALRES